MSDQATIVKVVILDVTTGEVVTESEAVPIVPGETLTSEWSPKEQG